MKFLLLISYLLLTFSDGGDLKIHKNYHSNDTIAEIYYTKDGVKHGEYKMFHENGQLGAKGYYNEGNRDSIWYNYYKNGNKSGILEFKKGKLISLDLWDIYGNHTVVDGAGTIKTYYDNGSIESEMAYKNNKKNGKMVLWDRYGFKVAEMYYKDDIPIGKWLFKNPQGEIIKEEYYDSTGTLIDVQEYSE